MRWLARMYFRLRGWHYEGGAPQAARYVVIGAPHTSNWDFVLLLAATSHFGIRAKVIGKDTLAKGPLGSLMKRLGIIPVRRDSPHGFVSQMAAVFGAATELALVIAPEGTRGAADYWRSGFYRIAVTAGVPIVPAKIDARHKRAVIGPEFLPSGDPRADMDHIRAFYADSSGFSPAGESTIRLRDEEEPTDGLDGSASR